MLVLWRTPGFAVDNSKKPWIRGEIGLMDYCILRD
jgi:hypothetical protein